MTVNIADLQATLAPLAERLADIAFTKKALEAEEANLKAQIRAATETAGPGTYGADKHVVTVALNRRFNEQRALESLPEALFPFVTHTQVHVDKEKLRALDEATYEASFDVYDARITVKDAS